MAGHGIHSLFGNVPTLPKIIPRNLYLSHVPKRGDTCKFTSENLGNVYEFAPMPHICGCTQTLLAFQSWNAYNPNPWSRFTHINFFV